MVDSENFSKRLKLIMENNQISATKFAEILNIPRSSISHLLSGRNKPSLDFVLKVLKNFSEVELYWLLNGTGVYPKVITEKETAPTLSNTQKETTELKQVIPTQIQKSLNVTSDNEIDRIVIFFKDGRFKSYTS